MQARYISVILFSAAVIAAAVAGIVIFNQKSTIARAEANRAASEEEIARREAKKAEAEKIAAASNESAETAKLKAAEAAVKAEAARAENLQLENENLTAKKAVAADTRAAAEAESKKAADLRAAKELELKAAAEKAAAERAKQAAAEAELARAEAQKAIREAETLKLRVSINELAAEKEQYQLLSLELRQLREELEERERALRPEKTAADLVWLGLDENGNDTNSLSKAALALPENDPMLPKNARSLSKAERIGREERESRETKRREEIVGRMEAVIRQAYLDGRVSEARYCADALKSIYPDWKLKSELFTEEKKTEKK